jgi:aryl carrier-like protein
LPAPQWQTASEGDAPQTDNEQMLATIWQQLLGRETVSRDDNFFALGGDSILALQVVSRARQQGLALTPKELFEQPVLKELAVEAVSAQASVISQQPLQGALPLLPIQQHFFSLNPPSPSHWNQHLWLALDTPMERPALEATLQALCQQHDALRLQFIREQNGWMQTCLPADAPGHELLWWRQAQDPAAAGSVVAGDSSPGGGWGVLAYSAGRFAQCVWAGTGRPGDNLAGAYPQSGRLASGAGAMAAEQR